MVAVELESTTLLTPDEFRGWLAGIGRGGPDDPYKYELLNGRVVMSPPVDDPVGEIELNVAAEIRQFVRSHRLGNVYGPSQWFELPSGSVVAPDATFIAAGRIPPRKDPKKSRRLRIVPDLVVEVISPSSEHRDRVEKKAIYEENGVREYWIVDWRKRRVDVFHLGGDGRFDEGMVYAESEVIASRVLAGLELPVADVLAEGFGE